MYYTFGSIVNLCQLVCNFAVTSCSQRLIEETNDKPISICFEGELTQKAENTRQSTCDRLVLCGGNTRWTLGSKAVMAPSSFIKCIHNFGTLAGQGHMVNLTGFVTNWDSDDNGLERLEFELEDHGRHTLKVRKCVKLVHCTLNT